MGHADKDEEIAKLKQLLNDGHVSLIKENEQLKWACAIKDVENSQLRSAFRDIYEVWAGSEGVQVESHEEAYLQLLIKQMTDIAARYMK